MPRSASNRQPQERLIKSKQRVKKFGEVFTPETIVKRMCDLCEPEISRIDSKIFEPTCGDGNFLVEILRRKLASITYRTKKQFEFEIILAVSNVYGVDIQQDNVDEARRRLRHVIFDFVGRRKSSADFLRSIELVLMHTILVGNTLTEKEKLTFYDFSPHHETCTFEITPHTLENIEKTVASTRRVALVNLEEAFCANNSSPPGAHTKRKPPVQRVASQAASTKTGQMKLFKE